jgi:predicted SnoaL-like aldol condensation-catalyzing enzyme
MSTEQNKAVVRRFWDEAWNAGNLAMIDEIYDPNHQLHVLWQNPAFGGATEAAGPGPAKDVVGMWRSALPDLHVEIVRQVAEGDKVMTQHTCRGHHSGTPFMGIQPSGRPGTVTGMTINRVVDGKIVDTWTNWDALTMLQDFGVIPRMGPPPAPAPKPQ